MHTSLLKPQLNCSLSAASSDTPNSGPHLSSPLPRGCTAGGVEPGGPATPPLLLCLLACQASWLSFSRPCSVEARESVACPAHCI